MVYAHDMMTADKSLKVLKRGRDLDDAESAFTKASGIRAYTVEDIRLDSGLIRRMAREIQSGKLVGLGVYEYAPCGKRNACIEKLIHG